MRRVAALRGAEDSGPDAVFWGCGGGGGDCDDDAGELGTGDPGEGRLVLVFAADLEEVEEVGCGCVDGDEVFVWRGRGCGEGGDGEVGGALGEGVSLEVLFWEMGRRTREGEIGTLR